MRPRRFVLHASLLLACALAAAQPARPRLTVLPFEGTGVAPGDLRALTLFFETALQNTGRCQIMEQAEVDKILKAHQYVLADFNDPTKAVAIGKLIPADHIVLGAVGTLSGKYYVNVKMIELRTGTNVAARNATAPALDALSDSLTDVARQMVGLAPAAASPPTQPLAPPLTVRTARLSFFESGPGIPQPGSRVYTNVFRSTATRFVNWELHIGFDQATSQVALPIEAIFYRPDGSVLTTQPMTAEIQPGWEWYMCWNGWGNANPGTWQPGTYTVQASVASTPVASATFVLR